MNRILPAAALVIVLAACGSAEDVREEPISLDAAVEATTKAGSARTETVSVMKRDGETTTTHSTGIHDYRAGRSEIVWTFGERRSRTIFIGEISYAELDERHPDQAVRGKRWLRSEPLTEERFEELTSCDSTGSETAAPEDEEFSCSSAMILAGSPIEDEDPGTLLDLIAGYAPPAKIMGREEVRGVTTTHLRMRVDFHRASQSWYEERGWSRENVQRLLESVPREPAQVDVWVDADALVRRIRTTRSDDGLPPDEDFSEGFGPWTSTETTEYFDYGVEVDIREPPASEVIDFDDSLQARAESR